MAGCVVHPGAVEPYERLEPAELLRLDPSLDLSARARSFYGRLAQRAGHVLEYGAGRGTLTWEMARRGARVVAVECSTQLLSALSQQGQLEASSTRKRVRVVPGDMRSVPVRGKFPLVIAPASTFLHLYNRQDVEAFLQRVRQHLADDGRFVFDIALPEPDALGEDYDPVSQVLYRTGRDGVTLAQRQFFPRELSMLLWYNGLRNVRFRSDFTGRLPRAQTRVLVVTAC